MYAVCIISMIDVTSARSASFGIFAGNSGGSSSDMILEVEKLKCEKVGRSEV